MNWNQVVTEVVISIIGVIVSCLGIFITYLINKFIKNDQVKATLNSLHDLIRNSVLEIYQTYVEELKDKNIFDENAQKLALERCLELIKTNMPNDVKTWLETNVCDIQGYLKSLIEAQIGSLKNSGK